MQLLQLLPVQLFADLEAEIAERSMDTVLLASISLVFLVIVAILLKDRIPKLKLPLFILMATIMIGTTLSLIGSTVYLNVTSDSGGPVHWHADVEMWACGAELELRDPTGFSNKIGTPTLHEHNDHRIHLEGVVVDREVDATIGKFMNVIGGGLSNESLIVPLNPSDGPTYEDEVDGDEVDTTHLASIENHITGEGEDRVARFVNGNMCGEEEGEVQVFVYQVSDDGKLYTQYKLQDDEIREHLNIDSVGEYSISETPNVPPGDCIIFEFDVPKDTTDKLCAQFGVRDIERCEQFGVEPQQREICDMEQIPHNIGSTSAEQKVTCRIMYDDQQNIVSIKPPADYSQSCPFDPQTQCNNIPAIGPQGEID